MNEPVGEVAQEEAVLIFSFAYDYEDDNGDPEPEEEETPIAEVLLT